jgi:hypothetical protein
VAIFGDPCSGLQRVLQGSGREKKKVLPSRPPGVEDQGILLVQVLQHMHGPEVTARRFLII